MFTIVDIESSGGDPRRDRITEVAVFVHNGQRVVEQYCTLVNPQTYISPFITALTGITNDMVAQAPLWCEVAPKIKELTEGKVFVAHNVRFDYTFIANEFKRIDQRFVRKQLCTVRLSRNIMPGLPSYNLGRLCQSLGIPIEHRHRAFGDGAATAELFDLLLQRDRTGQIKAALKEEIKQSLMPPNLTRSQLDQLPEDTGVYYLRDERGKALYIGKSVNIRKRVYTHLTGDMVNERYHGLKQRLHHIDYEVTGNELVALLRESEEIKRWMPPFNSAGRRSMKDKFGVYLYEDAADGTCHLRVAALKPEGEPVLKAPTLRRAEQALQRFTAKHGLCPLRSHYRTDPTWLQLDGTDHECDQHCPTAEGTEAYNQRVWNAIGQGMYDKPDFVITAQGRKPDERAVVMVCNGGDIHMGYLENEANGLNFEELRNALPALPAHPDYHSIIKGFIKRPKKGVEVRYREN